MDVIDWQVVLAAAARHVLTTWGGWLIAHGFLQADGLQGFVGAGMVFAGVAWSWWQKRGQALALAEAQRAYNDLIVKIRKPPAPSVGKP